MSWFSENYEKASLGGGILLGLGLAYLGWSALSGVDSDFGAKPVGKGPDDASVAMADAMVKTAASIDMDHSWNSGEVPGDGRKVDLMVGIPLFIKRSEPEKVIDLLKDKPVHDPVDNMWWLENGLDPGFSNALEMDPDKDGFTNLEEYHAKTDPNNVQDHPSLIDKLRFAREEFIFWVLRPADAGQPGAYMFRYQDSLGRENRMKAADPPAVVGSIFFADGVQKGRFKLIGEEKRVERNEALGVEEEKTFVKIEDQKPNKLGKVYEYPAPLRQALQNQFLQYDRTAILSLEALGLHGQEFKVEENTPFALPPNAERKGYLLKTVLSEKIVVEYTDASGKTQSLEIQKGQLPSLNP